MYGVTEPVRQGGIGQVPQVPQVHSIRIVPNLSFSIQPTTTWGSQMTLNEVILFVLYAQNKC